MKIELPDKDGLYQLDTEVYSMNISIKDNIASIHTVSINSKYRRQGYFKKLIKALQSKYNLICLEAWPTLVPMYVHLGFKDCGVTDDLGYHELVFNK